MPLIDRICLHCQKPFVARVRDVARGWGRYCSQRCSRDGIGDTSEVSKRFWAKVNQNGPMPYDPALGCCWVWIGHLVNGYGQLTIKGKRFIGTHRWSLEQSLGKSLGKLHALHKCDNPACVRPSHLYAGTHQDNMRDAVNRHRMRNVSVKLEDSDARKIRLLAASGVRYKDIASQFRVNPSTISLLVRRKTWKHLA